MFRVFRYHPIKAFTLIELSIVLVIIGLIAGGVLVGRDLIEMAQARRVMTQMEQIQVAAHTFNLKYNCIIGDCPNAISFGLGTSGNGDFLIGGTNAVVSSPVGGCLHSGSAVNCMTSLRDWSGALPHGISRSYGEAQAVWQHLSSAQLIPWALTKLAHVNVDINGSLDLYFPKDALGKYYMTTFMWNRKLFIHTGLTSLDPATPRPQFENALLSAAQAKFITEKLNYPLIVGVTSGGPDALDLSHKVIPLGMDASSASNSRLPYVTPTTALPAASFNACVVSDGSGGYVYNINNDGRCNMLWQIDIRN